MKNQYKQLINTCYSGKNMLATLSCLQQCFYLPVVVNIKPKAMIDAIKANVSGGLKLIQGKEDQNLPSHLLSTPQLKKR